jgi:hypothetical protein
MRQAILKVIAQLILVSSIASMLLGQTKLQSRDGYIRRQGTAWVLGTARSERHVQLVDGQLVLVSLRNKNAGRSYLSGKNLSSTIDLLVDGSQVTGWELRTDHVGLGLQGELQLDLELESSGLIATRHYVVYPGSSVVREWTTLKNLSKRSIRLSHVNFLHTQLVAPADSDLQFNYVTGGGPYNGSQLLKAQPMNAGFRRSLDSNENSERLGYSSYLPLIFIRSAKTHDGVAIGWDYLGHWQFELDKQFGIRLELAGYEKELPPGAQIDTPKAFITTFSGDVDDLGNQLIDWQYEYLWDFTNPDYFAKTRFAVDWPGPWMGEGGTPSADNWGRRLALDLRYIDLLRETGTDILWDDAGWYDKWGSWAAPDWKQTTDYLRKHDMKWVLWYPTFLATPESKTGQQHSEWIVPGEKWLDQSIPATVDWQNDLLDKSVQAWGDYQWRYDVAPAASANDTDALAADQNFRRLLQRFKVNHPKSGIDACYGGGRWISYDIARLSESGEYTDGGVGPYSPYYSSLIVPPDKFHNVVDFDHTHYQAATDRVHLTMNPVWYRDPDDGPDVQAIRKDWELYHYMVAQGVAGRWSHVFRPKVDHDNAIWYAQRMSRNGSKGVIITKHAKTGATYLVTSRLKGHSEESDHYHGGAAAMNVVTTTLAATVTSGIYEDTADGTPRFYGVPGQEFGPLNIKYQEGTSEQSLVTRIVKLGAERRVRSSQFFGMELEPREPLTITQLGQHDPWARSGEEDFKSNRGTYTLSLVRAEDGTVLATADLDMSAAKPDAMGFKYVQLSRPIRLETAAKPVVIYPKGLVPKAIYDVRTINSDVHVRESGSKLMSQGISLDRVTPGELIFLNLPNYPGSDTDHTAPTSPPNLSKRVGTNLGVQGIEVTWAESQDNNWISYYEIQKNGKLIGKTAKGTYFFDHSDSAAGDIEAVYEVRAVDGDGNRSPFVTARKVDGDPPVYDALGGFSSVQRVRNWVYEEIAEDGSYREMSWEKGGYEGRWAGSGLGKIGRIWMQPAAGRDLSRTFVVPAGGAVSASGTIRKDPSAENGVSVFVKILLNEEQVWPDKGWAEVFPDYDLPISYEITNLKVVAKDKVRFIVKHNGENRADPIEWGPKLIFQK